MIFWRWVFFVGDTCDAWSTLKQSESACGTGDLGGVSSVLPGRAIRASPCIVASFAAEIEVLSNLDILWHKNLEHHWCHMFIPNVLFLRIVTTWCHIQWWDFSDVQVQALKASGVWSSWRPCRCSFSPSWCSSARRCPSVKTANFPDGQKHSTYIIWKVGSLLLYQCTCVRILKLQKGWSWTRPTRPKLE